jgi:hypothetical protein
MTEVFMEQEPLYKQGWNDERKLLLKLSVILGEVGAIPKTGFNKFHGYHYHSEADINSTFQKLFHVHKIMFSASMVSSEMRETTTNKGNTEYIYKANMRFTFFDAETGESLTGCMSGEGQDNGDKALYKSISGTQKYILMKTFMITDHNDPEGDEGVDERNNGKTPVKPAQPPTSSAPSTNSNPAQNASTGQSGAPTDCISEGQTKMLYAKWKSSKHKELPKPDVCELISAELGKPVSDFKDVPKSDINKVIKWFEDVAA